MHVVGHASPRMRVACVPAVLMAACGGQAGGAGSPSAPATPRVLHTSFFSLPTADSAPTGIVIGPDGALWITEENGDRIARSQRSGRPPSSHMPRPGAPGLGIVSGPDGALWFTDRGADEVDRMTLTGSVRAIHLPRGSSPLAPAG
jgi:sugar lactone lactonase YvrE